MKIVLFGGCLAHLKNFKILWYTGWETHLKNVGDDPVPEFEYGNRNTDSVSKWLQCPEYFRYWGLVIFSKKFSKFS